MNFLVNEPLLWNELRGWVERGNSQFVFGKSGDQDKPIWVTDPDASHP
jgi:hypothetical protein